jgi:hypothetical protein
MAADGFQPRLRSGIWRCCPSGLAEGYESFDSKGPMWDFPLAFSKHDLSGGDGDFRVC